MGDVGQDRARFIRQLPALVRLRQAVAGVGIDYEQRIKCIMFDD
jgi:hypothetical protein